MYSGIINVYKEKGYTSHDVVAKLRGILKQKKIGHTGTLDPQAEGVLPVCLGAGTKLCELLTDKDKEYEALLLLGVSTDTQDITGTVQKRLPVTVSEEEVLQVIGSFVGEYEQIPPMYSAIKIDGKKLYELAREGKEIERKARTVSIVTLSVLSVELPRVRFRVACSKGTYIRTLCHDIGEKLGCGGCMEELVRTRAGSFRLEEAVTLGEIEKKHEEKKLMSSILSVEEVLSEYPVCEVKPHADRLIYNGNPFEQADCANQAPTDIPIRVRDSGGRFVGLYVYRAEKRAFYPLKMFLES